MSRVGTWVMVRFRGDKRNSGGTAIAQIYREDDTCISLDGLEYQKDDIKQLFKLELMPIKEEV